MNAETKRINGEGRALLRIAKELREFLSTAPDEPESKSLMHDVETLERVGNWLSSCTPISTSTGIPAAGICMCEPSDGLYPGGVEKDCPIHGDPALLADSRRGE